MKLSIIIVNYNVKELLLQCIDSVYRSTSYELEVIVVDNNSNDGSVDAVKEKFPRVIVISNTTNAGFSAANNQGIAIAAGEFIMLLNPDTEVTDGALNLLIETHVKHQGRYILAPQLLNQDGSIQASAWWFPTLTEIFLGSVFLSRLIHSSDYAPVNFKEDFEPEGISGAALFFSRATIDKIGLMDENLFWMEDIDLCFRNTRSGGKNIYLHVPKIIHYSGKSSGADLRIPISNQLISKLKFFRKHSGILKMALGSVFIFTHIVIRILLLALPCLFSAKARSKVQAYVYSFKKLFGYLFTGNSSIT